jgi:hypothetical protein
MVDQQASSTGASDLQATGTWYGDGQYSEPDEQARNRRTSRQSSYLNYQQVLPSIALVLHPRGLLPSALLLILLGIILLLLLLSPLWALLQLLLTTPLITIDSDTEEEGTTKPDSTKHQNTNHPGDTGSA